MSFILEAQKRDDAAIDPGAAAQLAIAEDRRGRWRWALWLIGIALVANAAILGYLFGPWNKAGERSSSGTLLTKPTASRELVVKPRERTGPTNRSTQPERTERSSSSSAAAREPATSVASRSSPPPASSSSAGRVLSPEQAAALNIEVPGADAPPATADAPAPGGVQIGPSSANLGPTPADEATASIAAADQAAPPAASSKPAKASTQPISLSELSPADRADFPELEFSTHVFADDPALRAVVVNSRRLSEGESIGEMVLRAVTEDGIIVDYRGQRVAVSVMDTWE